MASRRLFGPDVPGVVERLKRENARDILLFGIADLAATLFRQGLIDECRIGLCPIVLGQGTPLFKPGMRTSSCATAVRCRAASSSCATCRRSCKETPCR
ncbi:dihydrofolate reductase family protein [Bradyrhizobium sp. NP1]|nr:dihydrofolate reductase family protein [Bradyrhizobium sp. NP1]WJR81954.1 dihydrofolate reductase family protein [Bradyrhizobium sp. NP1]